MSFSEEWENRFAAGQSRSLWPWSDVVSYVSRFASPGPGMRVLELGCAAGANVPFFLALEADYYGVEGSPAAVEQLLERFPQLRDRITVGDFTTALPIRDADLVLDRSSLTHNPRDGIVRALSLIYDSLRPGGWYFGIDWFSSRDGEALLGRGVADGGRTRVYESGLFGGVGKVHFTDGVELQTLLSRFSIVAIDEKIVQRFYPNDGFKHATFNFAARKQP